MEDLFSQRLTASSLPPEYKQLIMASRQRFFDEVKPTKQQIEHGLELHYDSFVADSCGGVSACCPWGLEARRLEALATAESERLKSEGRSQRELAEGVLFRRTLLKTFESAFDPQWHRWQRELCDLAGLQLGTEEASWPWENTFELVLKHLAKVRLAYDNRDDVHFITHADQLRRALAEHKPAVILGLDAVGCFGEAEDPLFNLDMLYALGVRETQLTYIQDNKLAASWLQGDDGKGLTDLGRQAVHRMNELGIMIDLAHSGPNTMMDTIETSLEPVMLSHTGSAALYDDREDDHYLDMIFAQPYANPPYSKGLTRPTKPVATRGAGDEIFKALGDRQGYAGVYAFLLAPQKAGEPLTFDSLAKHIEHVAEAAGIDTVGIGSDVPCMPNEMPDPLSGTNRPYWTVGLVCRGFSDDDIRKINGLNYLRYALRVLDKKPWGPFLVGPEYVGSDRLMEPP